MATSCGRPCSPSWTPGPTSSRSCSIRRTAPTAVLFRSTTFARHARPCTPGGGRSPPTPPSSMVRGSVRAGHLAWEVEQLVLAGLEPHEALAAVTFRGGELLGIDHAGRIRQGDPADFVLVHGDPLSDPRALWRVWAVFQGGEQIA